MKLSIVHVALLAASLALVAQPAVAENRVALVFGQSAYRLVPTLPNPANDAKMMAGLLTSAGFEVTAVPDASQTEMRKAIADFVEKLNEKGTDTVALVYYAGHGLQVDGENFLLPVDVSVLHESDVPLQGVRLNDLLNSLALVPSKTRIIMLDACRDNPFPDLEKTIGHGLALVDTKAGSTGSFISFSTSPGAVAEDGTGADSPYTTALLTAAREHGLTIEEALKRVRVSVNQATDGRQTPWDSSSLTTDFYFFPGREAAHAPQTTGERTAQGWRRSLQALQPKVAYERVIAEDTVEAYEAFLVLFVGSPFASRVHDLLDRRREMVAWAAAVALNTPESYEAFLASYPTSDLAATARKLRERTRNRLQVAALGQASIPISGAATGAGGAGGLGSATAATSVGSAVPMCPCVLPPPTPLTIPPFKHVDTPPQKHVDTPSPPPPQKHVDISPPPPNVNPPKVVVQQPDSPPPPKKSKVFLPSDTPPQKHVDTPSPPPPQKHVDISPPPPIVNSPKVVVQQPELAAAPEEIEGVPAVGHAAEGGGAAANNKRHRSRRRDWRRHRRIRRRPRGGTSPREHRGRASDASSNAPRPCERASDASSNARPWERASDASSNAPRPCERASDASSNARPCERASDASSNARPCERASGASSNARPCERASDASSNARPCERASDASSNARPCERASDVSSNASSSGKMMF